MLATQIMLLRKKAGMSQLQLAQKLNVSPSAVGMYEQGRRMPAIDILIQMAALFGVSLDYLITGSEKLNSITDEKVVVTQLTCPCMTCHFCCKKHNLQRTNNRGNENVNY